MNHLALAVRDEEASRRFYETYFGFDAGVERMDDGVLMLSNAGGFRLALGPWDGDARLPAFLHFGISLADAAAVVELEVRLRAAGVEVVESWDEPGYVSRKVRDPSGYVVEVFWEA